MIFCSNEFLIFLGLATGIYFFFAYIVRGRLQWALAWLLLASLFFCGYSNWKHLIPLIGSAAVNFAFGRSISSGKSRRLRWVLMAVGISLNLGLLGYFKYYDFFISNVNVLFKTQIHLLNTLLPLGISFFTFQQIAYLVDCYKKPPEKPYTFIEYALFVSFFPKLISGPIAFHHEIIPPLKDPENHKVKWLNISAGLWLFSIGFFKKVVFADTFAQWVNNGFASTAPLSFWSAWLASLFYTLQIYFDFSGYCDMATGAARLFNINLPFNFDSPYKSPNIREFWRTWHMTLGRFLMQYLYIPLGGNRKGLMRTYINLWITFLLCGLWHGAGWTFIIWGAAHGAAMVAQRLWSAMGLRMHRAIGIPLTFLFVNCAWVLFRASDLKEAEKILVPMFTSTDFSLKNMALLFGADTSVAAGMGWFAAGMAIVFLFKNAMRTSQSFNPGFANLCFAIIAFITAVFFMNLGRFSPFIYLNF